MAIHVIRASKSITDTACGMVLWRDIIRHAICAVIRVGMGQIFMMAKTLRKSWFLPAGLLSLLLIFAVALTLYNFSRYYQPRSGGPRYGSLTAMMCAKCYSITANYLG